MAVEGNKYDRVINFSAGPAQLPLEVLERCRDEMMNFNKTGQGVMEMSHRSKIFVDIFTKTKNALRDLLKIPENYEILFAQGGATTQFSSIPLNIGKESGEAPDYIITGGWSKKAHAECLRMLGKNRGNIICDNTAGKSVEMPDPKKWKFTKGAPYVHYCANETVHGFRFPFIPECDSELVADFSSSFCSEPIDVKKFGVIYAGAQKNVGPAGVTILIIRKDLIGNALEQCPLLLNWQTLAKKDSMYNTPPCYTIYVCGLVFEWLQKQGGLEKIKEINEQKAKILYDQIDNSNGFYKCPVQKDCRSLMNVRFNVCKGNVAELEKKFLEEAEKEGMVNLKGHRSLGGLRASIYNAQTIENCQKLAKFMVKFQEKYDSSLISRL